MRVDDTYVPMFKTPSPSPSLPSSPPPFPLPPSLQILMFDFHSEVYVWVGIQSKTCMRKKAVELGKQAFDIGCRPPVFNLRSSPARASGRYRPRSSVKLARHSVVNTSGRRVSRVSRVDLKPRPDWALFQR